MTQPLLGATWRRSPVHDARGRSFAAPWLSRDKTTTAWIEVAQVAGLAADKRVIALAGSVAMNQNAVQQFDAVVPITARPMTPDEAMRDAGVLLEAAVERTARLLRLGQTL